MGKTRCILRNASRFTTAWARVWALTGLTGLVVACLVPDTYAACNPPPGTETYEIEIRNVSVSPGNTVCLGATVNFSGEVWKTDREPAAPDVKIRDLVSGDWSDGSSVTYSPAGVYTNTAEVTEYYGPDNECGDSHEEVVTILKVDITGLENVTEKAGSAGSWWWADIGQPNPLFGLTGDSYVPSGVTWEMHQVTSPPVGDAALTDNGNNTATVDQGSTPAVYLIKAISVDNSDCSDSVYFQVYCGACDGRHTGKGAEISIPSLPVCNPLFPSSYPLWEETDKCGNVLSVWCEKPSLPQGARYRFKYNGTIIGECVYKGGTFDIRAWWTEDGCRFHSTWCGNADNTNDGSSDDEGTKGKYDWAIYTYDCINEILTHDCYEGDVVGPTGDPSECETGDDP